MPGNDTAVERIVERSLASPVAPTRYDLVLLVIPLAFLASVLVGNLLAVPGHLSVAAASVLGALALADALFINPPRDAGGA